MRLPDKITVTCGMCGAKHESRVTYQQELKDNSIIVRVFVDTAAEFTRHVMTEHMAIEQVTQHLDHGNAEPPDVGDGDGAMGKGSPRDPGGQLAGSSQLSAGRSDLHGSSTPNGRQRLDLILDGE